jgi:hypothetical protein
LLSFSLDGQSKIKKALPEACQQICLCAHSKLKEVAKMLEEGNIMIQDLENIHQAELQQNLKKLYEAPSAPSYVTVKHNVKLRMQELGMIKEQQSLLLHVCQYIHHEVKGVHEAKQQLKRDQSTFKLNSLCTHGKSEIIVACFPGAHCLLSFGYKFYMMTKRFNSGIFDTTWQTTMDKAFQNNPQMSITDVEEQVWVPTFKSCESLLEQLKNQSILLTDVNTRFECYRWGGLEKELKLLFEGMNGCLSQTHSSQTHSNRWIRYTVLRIEDYWTLCSCLKAADTFLKLRSTLKLKKSGFKRVLDTSEMLSSLLNGSLCDIHEDMVESGKFLSNFSEEQLDCIQKFSDCQEIVRWIQDTTKDISDLQNFVNVSLATSAGGEDDLSNDRLANLRTVGSGFSSLVYGMKENTDFETLSHKCLSVWTACKKNKSLSKMLADCNKDLEWYKSVKDSQRSVQETSVGEMHSILSNGHYIISGKGDQVMFSIYDVVWVMLSPKQDAKDPKKRSTKAKGNRDTEDKKNTHNLEGLKDLESKLVLITGNKVENKGDVQTFLDILHGVCRIAEVMITLQQVGNVKYLGWCMKFPCKGVVVEDLQRQAKQMENELEVWKHGVKRTRGMCYELNYFTTQQLLVLQRELAKVRSSVAVLNDEAQAMVLLQSISNGITTTSVRDVVQCVQLQGTSIDVQHSTDSSSSACQFGYTSKPQKTTPQEITPTGGIQHSSPTLSLSVKDLNEKQNKYYTDIQELFSYRAKTALKAIEDVGDGDWNDIENWVRIHGETVECHFDELEDRAKSEEEEEGTYESEDSELGDNHKHSSSLSPTGMTTFHIDSSSSVTETEFIFERPKGWVIKENVEDGYLTLEELGKILRQLSQTFPDAVHRKRQFPERMLSIGQPNLLVVSPGTICTTQ